MKSFTYVVKDELGIHARPAGLIVNEAKKYASTITIECEGKKAVATKLMALMAMAVKMGQTICVTVEGEDEAVACEAFEKFIQTTL